jgi:NAD(P)-dependent dehydrogenase (short-subunit alcohol dehydrogenase family)/carbon monoxide dehydrogenase subunit G
MTRLHEIITVPRPIDEVFRYTSNFANIEQWDPGVSASEKITAGPVQEGSEFRVVVKSGPSSTPMNYRVKTFDPPNLVVLEGQGGSVHAIDEIRFTAISGGTQIEYTADITLSGLAGVFQPLMGGILDTVGKKALAGLKKALSAEPPVPAESLVRNLADRLVLPGALGFTRFGYARRKKSWQALAVSLQGSTAVVTGATSGLGRIAAERLAELEARVILVGRNKEKLDRALEEIVDATGNQNISLEIADLSLMADVRSLAQRLLESEPEIDILVNNAAVLPLERSLTAEGFETAFATDLLSPFLLTRLLLPRLKKSAPSRIINVLSGGMYLSGLDVHDLQNAQGDYDGSRAYARAKRGLMVLTELWAAEFQASDIVVNAMHPGWADTPGVQTSLPGFHKLTRSVLRTPEEGADTIVWLAAAPEAGRVSGKFWLDREPHLAAIIPGTAGDQDQRKALVDELERLAELSG